MTDENVQRPSNPSGGLDRAWIAAMSCDPAGVLKHINQQSVEIERLRAENARLLARPPVQAYLRLYAALKEAMEWNWLAEDAETSIPAAVWTQCEVALTSSPPTGGHDETDVRSAHETPQPPSNERLSRRWSVTLWRSLSRLHLAVKECARIGFEESSPTTNAHHADVWNALNDAQKDAAVKLECFTKAGSPDETSDALSFQARVAEWMEECFTRPDALTVAQRSFRFVEEALELAQAAGTSALDVMRLVAYVYDRPIGTRHQEIGGVMLTLAGLAKACGEDMSHCAEEELTRCIANTERIRANDLAKPERSPLPGTSEKAGESHGE